MVEWGYKSWCCNFYLAGSWGDEIVAAQGHTRGRDRHGINNVLQRIMEEKLKVNVKNKSNGNAKARGDNPV